MATLHDELRRFVVDNYLFFAQGGAELSDDTSFLENHVMDSTGVLELVSFLEKTYGIVVEDDELSPENLDSINRIAAYIDRKKAEARSA